MGTGGERIEAVLTCEGDIDDPDFPQRCSAIFNKLATVLDNSELHLSLMDSSKFIIELFLIVLDKWNRFQQNCLILIWVENSQFFNEPSFR